MPTLARIGDVELSAVFTETHGLAAEVSQHPVETGAEAADHVRRKGDTLKLEAAVSTAAPGDVRARLEKYLDEGEPLTVVTYRREYLRMVLTGVDFPDESKMGNALRLSASFQQVRLVETRTALVRQPKRVKTPPAEDKKDGDKKAGKPASDAVARRSQLKEAVDFASKGLGKFMGVR